LNSQDLWRNVKGEIIPDTTAYLIFDDTVINKKYGLRIELAQRQYSGNEHKVIHGIGIVNCIYFNRGLNNYGL